MNILIDADVIFDCYAHREPHFAASNQVLQRVRRGDLRAAVALNTLANGFYVFRRPFLAFAEKLLDTVELVSPDAYTAKQCLARGFTDLEDALQSGAALAWKSSFIVSRNTRHYRFSSVPALAPAEFLHRFFRRQL